jgi:hypothetical protein
MGSFSAFIEIGSKPLFRHDWMHLIAYSRPMSLGAFASVSAAVVAVCLPDLFRSAQHYSTAVSSVRGFVDCEFLNGPIIRLAKAAPPEVTLRISLLQ